MVKTADAAALFNVPDAAAMAWMVCDVEIVNGAVYGVEAVVGVDPSWV